LYCPRTPIYYDEGSATPLTVLYRDKKITPAGITVSLNEGRFTAGASTREMLTMKLGRVTLRVRKI